MMFGDVSAEEGVIIDEVAVVPTEGGVLIVGVTVDAGKNKMIIFWLTINVNFISYSNNLCKKIFLKSFYYINAFFLYFIQNTLFTPPCIFDLMMFGDVSEEGVIIDEVAVVPTEGGVLIVDVTVDAEKNKMMNLS